MISYFYDAHKNTFKIIFMDAHCRDAFVSHCLDPENSGVVYVYMYMYVYG